jgi:hypothetical protein
MSHLVLTRACAQPEALADDDATAAPAASPATTSGRPLHVFQALQYLRKVCTHPLLALTAGQPLYDAVIVRGTVPAHIWHVDSSIADADGEEGGDGDDTARARSAPTTAAARLQQLRALAYAPKLLALRCVAMPSATTEWRGGTGSCTDVHLAGLDTCCTSATSACRAPRGQRQRTVLWSFASGRAPWTWSSAMSCRYLPCATSARAPMGSICCSRVVAASGRAVQVPAARRRGRARSAVRASDAVQRRPLHRCGPCSLPRARCIRRLTDLCRSCIAPADDACGRLGPEPYGGGHGHLCRARLESIARRPSDGQGPPSWPAARCQCVPADHTRHPRGKDDGVSAPPKKPSFFAYRPPA